MESAHTPVALPIRPGSSHTQSTTSRRLNILDLPIDILKEVVKNLKSTNDLTSVARVHSAFHALATPHIYSRFDIVWPDESSTGEPRGGVDALTYGLATLNMAEDVFGEAEWQREQRRQRNASDMHASPTKPLSEQQIRKRRGNYYAKYVRKFSLGNGPKDWVEEYLANKEAGKMLGTLVALALARMKSLESFVWDLPIGIIGDIWTALSYLGDRGDGEMCRLERIWVRWPKNASLYSPPSQPTLTASGTSYRRVDQTPTPARTEHPSFSILPPLKSFSVVDIDEMQYLDEMSVLIGRSLKVLKELRVGISVESRVDVWVIPWAGDPYEQIDLSDPVRSTLSIGDRRRGGVLGVLTSSFLDLKQLDSPKGSPHRLRRRSGAIPLAPLARDSATSTSSQANTLQSATQSTTTIVSPPVRLRPARTEEIKELSDNSVLPHSSPMDVPNVSVWSGAAEDHVESSNEEAQGASPSDSLPEPGTPSPASPDERHMAGTNDLTKLQGQDAEDYVRFDEKPRKLHLETLELEWVPLSVPVLTAALDWTKLTSLTLLNCAHHDELWNALHAEYARDLREAKAPLYGSPKSRKPSVPYIDAVRLRLKNIHTNTVTLPLIRFINECLVPNTVESIFFQDFSGLTPSVSIDTIFNAVVKLHRLSLKRLLIDSCKRRKGGFIGRGPSWKHWAFRMEHLKFLTSGKVPNIKELGFSIDYVRDWHYFKQRLPSLSTLRSIYITRYRNQYEAPEPPPKDLAMQLLDAIVFNPAMDLCYMGIGDTCYEVLQGDPDRHGREGGGGTSATPYHGLGGDESSDDDDDDDDEEVEDEDEDEDEENEDEHHLLSVRDGERQAGGGGGGPLPEFENAGSESEDGTGSDEDDKLHLQEIMFYEDKVAIFRARKGKL